MVEPFLLAAFLFLLSLAPFVKFFVFVAVVVIGIVAAIASLVLREAICKKIDESVAKMTGGKDCQDKQEDQRGHTSC